MARANGFKIWDQLLHMNRQKTINNALSLPLKSENNNPYKDAIMKNAASNYALAARPYSNKEWQSLKIKLPKKDSLVDKYPWPRIESRAEYYNYDFYAPGTKGQDENIWVSFANKYVGGGYLKGGWVQEEIITAEFYEMADGINQYTVLGIREMALDETFLWFNLVQGSEAVPSSYGTLRIPPGTAFNVTNFIRPSTKSRLADFVSIDAPKRLDRNAQYTLSELQHLFVKSLVGFESATFFGRGTIHTGNWGAGDFKNNDELVYFVQLISGKLAGVNRMYFWGDKDVKDHARIFAINNLVISSPELTAEQVFDQIKPLFNISFTINQVYAPILNNFQPIQNPQHKNWYWLSGKNWVPYPDNTQKFMTANLTDTSKAVKIIINDITYLISYNSAKGWEQLNLHTNRSRPVALI